MKALNIKKSKLIMCCITAVLILLSVLGLREYKNNLDTGGRCGFFSKSLFAEKLYAALPPESREDLASRVDTVMIGRVTAIRKEYTDGDAEYCNIIRRSGLTRWSGSGTSNSQDIIVEAIEATKGNVKTGDKLLLKKGINAHTYEVGKVHVFNFNIEDKKIIGEYAVDPNE